MEFAIQFILVTVLSFFGIFFIYVRRKFFLLIPKTKKFDNDYMVDFIEWVLISWPPLIPLIGLMQISGEDMGWYLIPYFGVILGIFFVWFSTTSDEKKRRQSYPTVSVFLVLWIAIGLLVFQKIIQ